MNEEVNSSPDAEKTVTPPPPPGRLRRPLRICGRCAMFFIRLVVVVLVATAVATGALMWRLSQGPLNAQAFIPLIESALGNSAEDMTVKIGRMQLEWKGGRAIETRIDNMRLSSDTGEFLRIRKVDASLLLSRLLVGQLRFPFANVDGLVLSITREETGIITLTGDSAPEADGDVPEGEQPKGVAPITLTSFTNSLPRVRSLQLKNMRVNYRDKKLDTARRLDNVNIEIKQSFKNIIEFGGRDITGYMTMSMRQIDGSTAHGALDFSYDARDKQLAASVSLDKVNALDVMGAYLAEARLPIIGIPVEARANIVLNDALGIAEFAVKMRGEDGTLYWPRSYGEGLTNQKVSRLNIDASYDPTEKRIKLNDASIIVKGITLALNGEFTEKQDPFGFAGDLNVNIPVLAVDAIDGIWPAIWDSGARHWLVDRMKNGRFAQIHTVVPMDVTRAKRDNGRSGWVVTPGDVRATFNFTGVTVDYRAPLYAAAGTTGSGRFEKEMLYLDVERARAGKLAITKGTLEFDDLLTAGKGSAKLHFDIKGSVGGVFDYLSRDPISLNKKMSLDVSSAKGSATVGVDISFPTTKDMSVDDVKIDAKATLADLSLPGVVSGLGLYGGPFTVEATQSAFRLKGSGRLEKQPVTLDWHELFSADPAVNYLTRIVADVSADSAIQTAFIGTLANQVQGTVPVKVTMETHEGGKGTIDVAASMTAARVDFDPLSYVKPAGDAASLTLKGTLEKKAVKSITALKVTGSNVSLGNGTITFDKDGKLAKAALKNIKAGTTINATALDIEKVGASTTNVRIRGASFDARDPVAPDVKPDKPLPATKPKDGKAPAPEPAREAYNLDIAVDKFWLGEIPVDKAAILIQQNSDATFKSAKVTGTAAGAPVNLDYSASGLSWTSSNAGAALAAFGLTDRVRGGQLNVRGKPIANGRPGDMEGKVLLEKFSIVKAPALAKLVNALSLPGLLNLLQQDTGLRFERLEADMQWLNRPGGGQLVLKDGRTSGASLGLTFEGNANTATDMIDIQGTVVPVSGLNTAVGKIPLIGQLLTGGKGQGLIAATYTMKGRAADADVSVNPLSVLTPGILRRILFQSGSPAVTEDPAPASPPANDKPATGKNTEQKKGTRQP